MVAINRDIVLSFLEANPDETDRKAMAKTLGVKGTDRTLLRHILKALENEGLIIRTAKRSYTLAGRPPRVGVVEFHHIDEDGELWGQAAGRDGLYGPLIRFQTDSKSKLAVDGIGKATRALCKITKTDRDYVARVIKKLDAQITQLVGIVEGNKVKPTSRKDKSVYTIGHNDRKKISDGDLVLARLEKGRSHSKQIIIEDVIGHADNPGAASLIAAAAHDIPLHFPDDVKAAAIATCAADIERTDITTTPLITIDPADAKDHDDAVWAEADQDQNNKGGWKIIVAIADVAAYVHANSILDKEAFKRGNSTYFPDRVIPMLPEHLSNGECSLKEGELRHCFCVEMVFDKEGHKKSHCFFRAIMRSAASLSYNQAQAIIDEKAKGADPNIIATLKALWGAYYTLQKGRERRAPLELDLPERKILFDEAGRISSIKIKDRFEAHKLIEEFMIQANVCAAQTLEMKSPPQLSPLYRIHEPPAQEKLASLNGFLPVIGLAFPAKSAVKANDFNALLKKAALSDHVEAVSELVLRSQSQARYSPEKLGHFGLNLQSYAHFTSPIRRYSDVIVHRALISALGLGPDGLPNNFSIKDIDKISDQTTTAERRSMAAERDANDRYLAYYLADKIDIEFKGHIAGVTRAGLFIKLAETGADGFCPARGLSSDYWIYDDATSALIAEKSQLRYELGQKVDVKLIEATPVQGGLLFEMCSDPKPKPKNAKRVKRMAPHNRRHKYRR